MLNIEKLNKNESMYFEKSFDNGVIHELTVKKRIDGFIYVRLFARKNKKAKTGYAKENLIPESKLYELEAMINKGYNEIM